MHIAVVWPKPRQHNWKAGQTQPTEFPDMSDGFLFLEQEGIRVTLEDSLLKPLNPLVDLHHFYSGFDPLRAARVVMRANRYDAIVCVGDSPAFVLVLLKRLFGLRVPIILVDPALADGYPRRKRVQDYLLPRVEHIVVFGRVQLDYLRREYGHRLRATFLRHRADVEFYNPAHVTPRPVPRPFVFSIGNDGARDFETLSQAALLCNATAGFHHHFVVQTVLPFTNHGGALEVRRNTVSYAQLRDLYAQSSVVVLPLLDHRHAGGVNSLLESMAMAKPVVISRSHGIMDYVDDGSTAVLVPPRDPEAMAGAITAMLCRSEEARLLGENARRFVVDCCQNPRYARQMADVIRAAVNQR
jgi:glycosyltransferase involved in cell wall biosynthesis